MKRLLLTTFILIVGAGLGAGGLYVGTHWSEVNPFRKAEPKDGPLQSILAELRRTCAKEKELHGASIRSIEDSKGKLTLHGWIARTEQKALIEARVQELLNDAPELKTKYADGLVASLTVFAIPEQLMQLQLDFEVGKGAEKEQDTLQRTVMRMTRLDGAAFTEDGKLTFRAVCIRGNSKTDASADALKNAIKGRLEASGLAADVMPEIALDVRYFASPALLLQKQVARNADAKDVHITSAWYDGAGKLCFDGIVGKDEQKKAVNEALGVLVKDPNSIAIFRSPGVTEENLDISVRLVTFDASTLVGKLQKQLVEFARKENKPSLRRVRLVNVAPDASVDAKNQPVTDDQGNPSYFFRATGRVLGDANERVQIENELALWLAQQLPPVSNPDQTLMPLHLELASKTNPVAALQERLVERKLDGAVITDALYDEQGQLELMGRLHQAGAANKQALDAAFKDLLADEQPWTSSALKAHETRKAGQAIAWKDVVRDTQAKLASDMAVGKRVRLDRLYYRYEKQELRLVADGAFLVEGPKDNLAQSLSGAVDDVIATRGKAPISITAIKTLKNPLPELQNQLPDLDGVLLTRAHYDADGLLHIDGYLGQPEHKATLTTYLAGRLGNITDIVRKASDPKAAPGWSIDGMKVHTSAKGEMKWTDLVRACQSELATAAEEPLRRAHVERLYFQYPVNVPTKPVLHWKGTFLAKPGEKANEPALAQKLAEVCKRLLPDVAIDQVTPALQRVDSPIFTLQEQALKNQLDGLLFRDAYYDATGKLVLEGKRGSDEQLKDLKTLLDQLKTPIAPGGLAAFDQMKLIAWQPLLGEIRAQFAQSATSLHRQTRIDRVYFQHDDATKKATLHVEGICIYQGKTPTEEEQTGILAELLKKQLQAKGIEGFEINLRGIERKANPAPEMQKRAIEAGMDGVSFNNIGFDAKNVCYVKLPLVPKGQEENIRKLLEEFSKKHPHLGPMVQQ